MICCFFKDEKYKRGKIMEIREHFCVINDIDFDISDEVIFADIFNLHENFRVLPKQIITINLNIIPFNSKF